MRSWYFILAIFLTGCSGISSLQESNDWFSSGGNSDKNFTQGLEFSHTPKGKDNLLVDAASYLPSFSPNSPEVSSATVAVGQKIYTPENLAATELQVNDNPYAGWLYGEVTRTSQVQEVTMYTSLALGVVGPSAQGEEVQSWFHRLCDCQNPNGWDNQLKDEPGFVLSHLRLWTDDEGKVLESFPWNESSEVQVRLGNVHTDFMYAKTFQITHRFEKQPDGFDYSFFTRLGSYIVGRNIFYDGNTFKESHSVETEPLVGFFIPGLHVQYKGVGVEFSWVARTKDYEEQTGSLNTYGMITVGVVPQVFMGLD